MDAAVSIFNNFAFPTATVMALMWFTVFREKTHREDMHKKDEQIERLVNVNTEQNDRSVEAIKNLTVVVQELITFLKSGGGQNGNQ